MEHEGEKLKNWLLKNKMKGVELAFKTGTTKQNVYYHLNREKIDDSFKRKLTLAGVSIFDFEDKRLNEPESEYASSVDWKKKYYELLEKYTALLERKK